jgi:hypothetical protein
MTRLFPPGTYLTYARGRHHSAIYLVCEQRGHWSSRHRCAHRATHGQIPIDRGLADRDAHWRRRRDPGHRLTPPPGTQSRDALGIDSARVSAGPAVRGAARRVDANSDALDLSRGATTTRAGDASRDSAGTASSANARAAGHGAARASGRAGTAPRATEGVARASAGPATGARSATRSERATRGTAGAIS